MSATQSSRSICALQPIYALYRKSSVLVAASLMAACGGGGGGGGSTTTTPPPSAPPAATYTIGGTVSGLTGSGLVLQDNGGNNLTVTADATSFTFSTALAGGAAYAVSVSTQPSSPAQVCTVASGSGTVASSDVASVAITCTTPAPVVNTFKIGGTIAGLTASGLVLQDNGGAQLAVSANATTFQFPASIATGNPYAVTVSTQPSSPAQVCTVAHGSGTVGSANVTTVAITCSTSLFTIGGSISGLTSGGLVLQDTAGDHLTVPARAASFVFPTSVPGGSAYTVSVLTQPSNPAQTCSVANGSGTTGAGNVTTVAITCSPPLYKVGGSISGLTSSGLVLQDNAGDNLTVPANATTFTFATGLQSAKPYAVTVLTQPTAPAELCTVTNGSGTVASSNITNISVSCARVGQFVFVANSTDGASSNGDVSAFAINSTSGVLTPVTGSPFALGTNDQYPTGIAIDQNGHAYVSNGHSTDVAFLDIAGNGALSFHADYVSSGTSGSSIAVSAIPAGGSNPYLYVAGSSTLNVQIGSVSGFKIDPNSGDLSSNPNTPYEASNPPTAVAVDPATQFVFATSSSHDWIFVYSIGTAGDLTQLLNSPYSTNQGSPYGVVASPLGTSAGGFVYTANPATGSVSGFSYDNTGNLTAISGSPFQTDGAQPEGIAIDPAGKYLYVTNYQDGDVTSFSIDPQSGALTLIGSPVNTGNLTGATPTPGPIDVKVDPSGQFVYVVNKVDGSVSLFTANAGTLTLAGTYAAGAEATAAAIE
jgi:6-phosphogluconolactonase (cycloisomerase 2 family)